MLRDNAVLLDIKNACYHIQDFIEGMEKEVFISDFKTQSAVLHKLLVIGEAVKRLSTEFRNAHVEIPWSLIAGMRDKMIHGYPFTRSVQYRAVPQKWFAGLQGHICQDNQDG